MVVNFLGGKQLRLKNGTERDCSVNKGVNKEAFRRRLSSCEKLIEQLAGWSNATF
jgi:hypothetical protein